MRLLNRKCQVRRLLAGLIADAWSGLWLIRLDDDRLHDVCKVDILGTVLCKQDTYDKGVALLSGLSHKAVELQGLAGF